MSEPEITVRDGEPIAVLMVQDDVRFRESFAAAIDAAPDLRLCGCAAGLAAGKAMLGAAPDVLLVDLGLPDGDGVDLIRETALRLPDCDILVVTVFGDEQRVLHCIEAGATGYLLKDLAPELLIEQIRVLHAGGSPISPTIARRLLNHFAKAAIGDVSEQDSTPEFDASPRLSHQESEVLSLAAKGYTYDEIAKLLQLSPHTVQTYVKRIYRKLQVNSKTEALTEARRLRLIRP